MDNMTVTVPHEPVWLLDRRGSSGHLFWRRDSSKVKFRCDVEILEYVKDPREDQFFPETHEDNKIANILVIAATCMAAVCATVVIPWLLIGSS
ncbi:uncharacterized protein LOC134834327 [Culicoides brevitarsis]|uniref:uncharacterized protein LOC134834327 n=1 Tax=Culicoides brevitarsis TaxID=469753 RepID=UPI00307C49EC